jgi:hypothetical protein
MKVRGNLIEWLLTTGLFSGELAMMSEKLFEVFRTEERDLCEEEFTLD